MTASTLYQAVEPRVVWRQLLGSILQEIIGDGIDCEVRPLSSSCAHTIDMLCIRRFIWLISS